MRVNYAGLAAFALIAGNSGCTSCSHNTYKEAMRPVEEVEVIAAARARVNVFLMNGTDLLELGGLSELKDQIIAGGFPKAYYAQRIDREWFRREIHRLRREDPDNRFVLIGYGTAADQLRQLACQLTTEEIQLDTVLFIDPACENTDLTNAAFPSLVIRSPHWKLSPRLQTREELLLPGTTHPSVPNSPATTAQVLAILTASAKRVPLGLPPVECVPEQDDRPKPRPRPSQPKATPPLPPGWEFLCPNADGK